jgi:class 3 adenylate cyclase
MTETPELENQLTTLGAMRLKLLAGLEPEHFTSAIVRPGISYVGRTAENDIVLGSTLVSRRHAKLLMTDEGLTVHDLDSYNGVFRNGEKIRAEKLVAGDNVYFGDVCLEVEEISDTEMYSWLNMESGLSRSEPISEIRSDVQKNTNDPSGQSLSVLLRGIDGMLEGSQEEFMDTILNLCLERTEAQVGVIVESKGPDELVTHSKYWELALGDAGMPIHWQLVKRCLAEAKVLTLVPESGTSEKSSVPQTSFLSHVILVVPIIYEGKTIGTIYVSRPESKGNFKESEIEVIAAFGHVVACRMGAEISLPLKKIEPENNNEVEALQKQVRELEERTKDFDKAVTQNKEDTASILQLESQLEVLDEKCTNAEAKQKDSQIQFETANQMLQSTAAEADKLLAQVEQLERGDAFYKAAKDSLFPAVLDRIMDVSQDRAVENALSKSERTALCISLSGVEKMLEEQNEEDGCNLLEKFSRSIWKHAANFDGRIEQSMSKLQMILFSGDTKGTENAISCARAVLADVPSGGSAGVQCGIHVDVGQHGFFGGREDSLLIHLGRAVSIAYGACEYCPPGQIYATETIRKSLEDLDSCVFIATGPHLIRGYQEPVNLYQLAKG